MKSIIRSITSAVLAISLVACSTSEKFTISGPANTKIYTPKGDLLTTIGQSGKASVELTSDAYYAFLLSNTPGTDEYIPFALNTKERSTSKERFMKGVGITITLPAALGALVGAIAMCAESGDDSGSGGTGLAIIGGSLALVGIGSAFLCPAESKLSKDTYRFSFQYENNQSTNSNVKLTKANIDYVKYDPQATKSQPMTESVTTKTSASTSSILSSSAAKAINSGSAGYGGTYVGSGELKLNGEVIDKYSNVSLNITSQGENKAKVNVTVNGEKLFTEDILYNVTENNGKYLLIMKDTPTATINIEKSGELRFSNPALKLEGVTFQLDITAKK